MVVYKKYVRNYQAYSTTQNFQNYCKDKYEIYKESVKQHDKAMKVALERTLTNLEQTVVFNMRDIIEPIMLTDSEAEVSFTPHSPNSAMLNFSIDNQKGVYEEVLGINKITGKPNTDYSIPYNSIFVETENNELTYCSMFIQLIDERNFEVEIYSMTETFWVDGKIDEHGNYELDYETLREYDDEVLPFIMSRFFAVLQVFRRMNDTKKKDLTCYMSADETSKPTYIRNNKESVKLNPKPTYIILNKKDEHVARKYSNTPRGEIKYSFSWLVRGHYRTLKYENHYGKDRFGNYTLKGKTWIEPFTKGDKSLPLKKSEKIVIEQ